MLHEMMHIDFTAPGLHIPDRTFNGPRAYTAPGVAAWVGSGASTSDVINNADSYAQFVNAIYWKNALGYLPPPDLEVALTPQKNCIGGGGTYKTHF